jgi:uncharacterized alpha-E superfamily protein
MTMLSRVADSLYWMSRYLERAEHTARVVNVNLNLTLDRSPADAAHHWGHLLGSLPAPPPLTATSTRDPEERSIVDLANRESIAACVARARENARQVREEISSEMWEEINSLYLTVQGQQQLEGWSDSTHAFLSSTVSRVHLVQGVTDATMTHGEGWHFIELGRYLERAGNTAALLELHYREFAGAAEPSRVSEYVEWVGVLKSCCAFEAYCKHYTADLRSVRIAEFLVLSADFPRSIRYAVNRIQASLKSVASITGRVNGRAERQAGRLLASLDYANMEELIDDLPAFLQDIVGQTHQIGSAVHQQFVDYEIDRELSV